MGHPIQGPVKLIVGPIQRHSGPYYVHRVYFLCKSTEFYDMRTECQRIKNYRLFITVLLIYHK